MNLRDYIIKANKAYRLGRPIMTDIEFDKLCEDYQKEVSADEYDEFRNSLHEETGKVEHPYVMGSLDKLKVEEPKEIFDWLRKYGILVLSMSAKVDGISCRIHYNNAGQFVSATTRGDGYFGQDITDKVRFVQCVPMRIKTDKPVDIRGELVITNEDFEPLASTLKNPRNACAGIMGQKDVDERMVEHITFIAYEIMGGELSKNEQFRLLANMGFYVVPHKTYEIEELSNHEIVFTMKQMIEKDFGFPTDGIVVSETDYKAEQGVYRPKKQMAVKVSNMYSANSVLVDVVWERPSKNGRITPVGIIDPVEVCGATINRVTLNNIDWIREMNLRIGSRITITRSNGVIPKIIDVLSHGEIDIDAPANCPSCGSPLSIVGSDIVCTNPDCGATGFARVHSFLTNLGIQHVSLKTLENLGISNFDKLLSFKADKNYKVQVRFENDLRDKMFGAGEKEIFIALPYKNVAEKTLDKMINFYGYEWLVANCDIPKFWEQHPMYPEFPEGIGELVMTSFEASAEDNIDVFKKIIGDSRFHGQKYYVKMHKKSNNKNAGKSICFTGTLSTMGRVEAQALAKESGFDVKTSVTNGLTYLVTNNVNSGSSKNKKAKALGVNVIDEEQFLAMCGM